MRFSGKNVPLLTALTLTITLSLAVPAPVHASPNHLVQSASGGCIGTPFCSTWTVDVTLAQPVTAGDIIVVAVASFAGIPLHQTASDTLGSSYVEPAFICDPHAVLQCAEIFYATAPSSGSDTITVTYFADISPQVSDVYVYELTGLTLAGLATSVGNAPASPGDLTPSVAPISFTPGAFIIGVVNVLGPDPYLGGSGFTVLPPGTPSMQGYSEYADTGSSPVTSPTTVPGNFLFQGNWAEAAIALSPSVQAGPVCPGTSGGSLMAQGATFVDTHGNTWTAPSGSEGSGSTWSSYFFQGPNSTIPQPMLQGWGGDYGNYGGQQGWIITFYC